VPLYFSLPSLKLFIEGKAIGPFLAVIETGSCKEENYRNKEATECGVGHELIEDHRREEHQAVMTRHVLIEEGDSASECIEETVGEPPEQEPASGDPIVYLARGPPSVGVNQRECEHQESR